MIVDCIVSGAYQTNVYIVRAGKKENSALIIDAGLDGQVLVKFLQDKQIIPEAVVFTHGHVDHIAGFLQLQDVYPDIKLYIHKQDGPMLTDPKLNLSALAGLCIMVDYEAVLAAEGDVIEVAGVCLKVIHTPGHTPGGMCLYAPNDNILFAGDTLFEESVGRTDFSGGSSRDLKDSIRQKLFVLPDATEVCPGHGAKTSIGHEKEFNPFVH